MLDKLQTLEYHRWY